MVRYVLAKCQVSALAPTSHRIWSMKMRNSADITSPTATQLHMQKEQTRLAYSGRPSPMAREMTEVPPMPKTVPTDMKIKKTGVARDTAATCRSSWVWPIKNVSARLYTSTISMAAMAGTAFFSTAVETGAFSKMSMDCFSFIVCSFFSMPF